MNQSKSPIAWLGYFILGIIVLIVVVQLLSGILRMVYWLATLALSVVLVAAVGYLVYSILRAAYRSQK